MKVVIRDEERVRCHKRFIDAHWQMIAAYSWERYQAKGRGAVIVSGDDIASMGAPNLAAIRMGYVAGTEKLLKVISGKPGDKEERWLAEYDPDAGVVLVVLGTTDISSYLVSASPKPSECHAMRKASQS